MKKFWLGTMLAAFLLSGGTAGAFDTEAEIEASLHGHDSLYTAYIGQPMAELWENFKGAKGWSSEIGTYHNFVFRRENSEDEYKKTSVYGQYFRAAGTAGPTGEKINGTWYVKGTFPYGDWVVWQYSNEFYLTDKQKSIDLFKRVKKNLIEQYGNPDDDSSFKPTSMVVNTSWESGTQIMWRKVQKTDFYVVMIRYQMTDDQWAAIHP